MKKVAMLLSGGVDSSVALHLLCRAGARDGFEVKAFYLKIWLLDDLAFLGNCPWEEDVRYAKAVCYQLGVPFEVLPMQDEYWQTVVKYVLEEVQVGRTPNPDVYCNSLVKFGLFWQKLGGAFDKVATGHYACVRSIDEKNSDVHLLATADLVKDQTYFLAFLQKEQLRRAIFPLSAYTKSDVRQLAKKLNLPTAHRKDSQGICFLGKIKFRDFLQHHLGTKEGNLINIDTKECVGTHEGHWFYTIGQRQGLGLGGGPWYVIEKNVATNEVFIANQSIQEKWRRKFWISSFNILVNDFFGDEKKVYHLKVKVRHGEFFYDCQIQKTSSAVVKKLSLPSSVMPSFTLSEHLEEEHNGFNPPWHLDKNVWEVLLGEADQGITPGQFAVFYQDQICIGGAVIVA